MAEQLCKGGCGTVLPKSNKSGYAWGHTKGCKADTPPRTPDATSDEEQVAEPEIAMDLNESQLERIWQMLPLPEKALAISSALLAIRE